jgi:hypothetical protein
MALDRISVLAETAAVSWAHAGQTDKGAVDADRKLFICEAILDLR